MFAGEGACGPRSSRGFKVLHSQMASYCMAETNLIALAMQEFAPHVGPELMHQVQAGVAQ